MARVACDSFRGRSIFIRLLIAGAILHSVYAVYSERILIFYNSRVLAILPVGIYLIWWLKNKEYIEPHVKSEKINDILQNKYLVIAIMVLWCLYLLSLSI